MMKKILIIVAILVVLVIAYFVTVGVLAVSGACPKYIDLELGIPDSDSPKDGGAPAWQHLFCPLSQPVW